MTREQKQALALAVVSAAADMLEDVENPFANGRYGELQDIPMGEMQAQLALWLEKLPTGGMWDRRLPDPMDVREARQS